MAYDVLTTIAVLALLLLVTFSPVASRRIAGWLEAVAGSLRAHAGGMDRAYAAYSEKPNGQ